MNPIHSRSLSSIAPMVLSPETLREIERLKREFAKNVSKSLNVFKTPIIGGSDEKN